jgi:hypothetical protein
VECSQRNGEIDGYRLSYYATIYEFQSILINGSNTNTFVIVGLQPRVDYMLTLRAVGGNYTLFGNESRKMVQTSVPQGIVISISGPFCNRYDANMQLLDSSSMVKCMATIA